MRKTLLCVKVNLIILFISNFTNKLLYCIEIIVKIMVHRKPFAKIRLRVKNSDQKIGLLMIIIYSNVDPILTNPIEIYFLIL